MGFKCEEVIIKVRARVEAADPDPSKRSVSGIFEFSVTSGGKEVKKYTVDLKTLKVYEGASKDAVDVNVVVDDDALPLLLKKELSIDDAVKNGTLKVSGCPDAIGRMKTLVLKLIGDA